MIFLIPVVVLLLLLPRILRLFGQRRKLNLPANAFVIGLFHPSCDGGGGGERVLWTAIAAVQQQLPHAVVVVYAASRCTGSVELAKTQFGLAIDANRVRFAYLLSWMLLDPALYPRFTLIAQSIMSLVPGYEAMLNLVPDLFVETVGFAFIAPLAKYCGAKVVSYVHYPTVSADMLELVQSRNAAFNNDSVVAQSTLLSSIKTWYYRAFSLIYGFSGSFSDVVMVNSSWTFGHISQIWKIPQRTSIVYPPCDTTSLSKFPLDDRKRIILSIAQFRPEKNHKLQIDALAHMLETHPELATDPALKVELVLVGGVRNPKDADRVCKLVRHIDTLGLKDSVRIVENASYTQLEALLSSSMIGLHTMWNEHFGISIIEYMAGGLIPIAHASGGPKMDIVKSFQGKTTGFLATTVQEYAEAMYNVLQLTSKQRLEIQQAARMSVLDRFSESAFKDAFVGRLLDALSVNVAPREDIQ